MKLVHRDDIPYKFVEKIEECIKKIHPNCNKIIFAGDLSEEKQRQLLQEIEEKQFKFNELRLEGKCIDCGRQMENWPPDIDDWEPYEGWTWFYTGNEDDNSYHVTAWQCPDCNVRDF